MVAPRQHHAKMPFEQLPKHGSLDPIVYIGRCEMKRTSEGAKNLQVGSFSRWARLGRKAEEQLLNVAPKTGAQHGMVGPTKPMAYGILLRSYGITDTK